MLPRIIIIALFFIASAAPVFSASSKTSKKKASLKKEARVDSSSASKKVKKDKDTSTPPREIWHPDSLYNAVVTCNMNSFIRGLSYYVGRNTIISELKTDSGELLINKVSKLLDTRAKKSLARQRKFYLQALSHQKATAPLASYDDLEAAFASIPLKRGVKPLVYSCARRYGVEKTIVGVHAPLISAIKQANLSSLAKALYFYVGKPYAVADIMINHGITEPKTPINFIDTEVKQKSRGKAFLKRLDAIRGLFAHEILQEPLVDGAQIATLFAGVRSLLTLDVQAELFPEKRTSLPPTDRLIKYSKLSSRERDYALAEVMRSEVLSEFIFLLKSYVGTGVIISDIHLTLSGTIYSLYDYALSLKNNPKKSSNKRTLEIFCQVLAHPCFKEALTDEALHHVFRPIVLTEVEKMFLCLDTSEAGDYDADTATPGAELHDALTAEDWHFAAAALR